MQKNSYLCKRELESNPARQRFPIHRKTKYYYQFQSTFANSIHDRFSQ